MCSEAAADTASKADNGARHPDPEHTAAAGSKAAEVSRLRFELLRSALYHDMCEQRALRTNRFAQFLTLFLGSGAFAAIASSMPLAGLVASALVAIIGGAQLVWDFAGTAHTHSALRQKFYALLAEAEAGGEPSDLISRATLLYAEEPPLAMRINRRAHDQAGESIYGDDFNRA